MRYKLPFLLLALILHLSVLAQEQIDLPGFGKLPISKSGNQFIVDFPKYGQFSFTGSINPLKLESKVTIDQLKNIPGYTIMSNLGLQDITLNLSDEGFQIAAMADTRKNLSGLFKMLNVSEPLLEIGAKISSQGFTLNGAMDFTRKPIVLNLVPDFTRFTYERVSIEAKVGVNDGSLAPGLTAKIEMRIKPTKWDPDLKTVMAVSYDLISQEITASGSMVDTWKNPIGISNLLKKDVMTFTNTAVSLGWIPGAPSPTTIGFALEDGKIFHLEFGIIMALSPADGEIALWGFRNKMTMNDFTSILREGFGLKVPDVFPKDIYIEDANILFSPNGGEVGEFEIESGFAMSGRAKFLGAVDGSLNFYANMDDGFLVDFSLDAAFKDALMKEIRKIRPLAPIMQQVLSTLEVRRVRLYLEAGSDLNLKGQTNVHVSVLNKPIKFDFQGSFDPQTLAQEIVKRVADVAGGEAAAVTRKVASTVTSAGKKSTSIASNAFNEASKQAKTVSRHITHSQSECDNKCIPDHARKAARPLLTGSNQAVQNFYDEVIYDLALINGETTRETRDIRSQQIIGEWNKLVASIDEDWNKIRSDNAYIRFYIQPSSASNGGRIYRRLVDEEKKKHEDFRNQIWNKLLTDTPKPKKPSSADTDGFHGKSFYIQSAMNFGKDNGGYWDIPGQPSEIQRGSNIQVWNLDNRHDRIFKPIRSSEKGYYEISIGNTRNSRVDIQGRGTQNGANVHTWTQTGNANQQFRFHHLGGGRFKIYDRNSGKILCLQGRKNANGTNVHLWNDHNGASVEWYLIDVKTKKPFIPND